MAKNCAQKFYIKSCLVIATTTLKDNDKENYVYNGCGVASDGKGLWSFNDDFGRKVIIFGVDDSSSSHTGNLKNYFLILGEEDTFAINGSFSAPQKKLILILVKQRQNFLWVWITVVIYL